MRAIKLHSLSFFLLLVFLIPVFISTAFAQSSESETESIDLTESVSDSEYAKRFDTAWRLVSERYWDREGLAEVWEEARATYEPQALAAEDDEAFFAVLEEMYNLIGDNHSTFVPPAKVEQIRLKYGDLACLGVFSQSDIDEDVEVERVQHSPEYAGELTYLGNIGYYLLPENYGYISLPDLATDFTSSNLRTAVKELQADGASAFILDMRDNGGGKLTELLQSAGIFTKGFILRTITNWMLPIPYPAFGSVESDLPLVVLINDNVHSAAEGLAGSFDVKGRATLIGETTAGNVETLLPFCFRDGSQAWVATGVLAPIRGATWEGRGVEPDIAVDSETALSVAIEFLNEELSQ